MAALDRRFIRNCVAGSKLRDTRGDQFKIKDVSRLRVSFGLPLGPSRRGAAANFVHFVFASCGTAKDGERVQRKDVIEMRISRAFCGYQRMRAKGDEGPNRRKPLERQQPERKEKYRERQCRADRQQHQKLSDLNARHDMRSDFGSQLKEPAAPTGSVLRLLRRLARHHRPRWFLCLRELNVQFAVTHRSDKNVDDHGDLVERRNGDGVLTLLELNRFRS